MEKQFEDFKYQLLLYIKNRDINYRTIIEKNDYLITEYLNRPDKLDNVKSFVNGLIDIIIDTDNYEHIEYVLNHPLMELVSEQFKQSNVLIRACIDSPYYKNIVDWVLPKDIDLYTRDEFGRTALMAVVTHYNLGFLIDFILNNCSMKYASMEDDNGNTALFYAVPQIEFFKKLLDFGLDYNHVNKDGDTILMYACKLDKLKMFDNLIKKPDFNVHQINNIGKNLAMLLIEKRRSVEFKILVHYHNIDLDYKNRFDETLVSILIKNYYSQIESKPVIYENTEYKFYYTLKSYISILRLLVYKGCNFNIILDSEGNTPIIFFMLMKDYLIAHYLLVNCKKNIIDLSIKNIYGVNASYLLFFTSKNLNDESFYKNNMINSHAFKQFFLNNPTFDYSYLDSYGNTLLIHSIIKDDWFTTKLLMRNKFELILNCNYKKENGVIIAAKLGKYNVLYHILTNYPDIIDINHQDTLGNTALFYAVKLKDRKIIDLLMKYKANPSIPNVDGVTALDVAKEMNDPSIVKYIQNYLSPSDQEVNNENSFDETEEDDDKDDNRIEQNDETKASFLKNVINKIWKKEKNIDEKLDDYIKKYRITSYQKEYDYLLNYEFISNYRPSNCHDQIQSWIRELLYTYENYDLMPISY